MDIIPSSAKVQTFFWFAVKVLFAMILVNAIFDAVALFTKDPATRSFTYNIVQNPVSYLKAKFFPDRAA